MMIQGVIYFKVTLVDTGGNNGLVTYFYRCDRRTVLLEWILDADRERRAIRLVTNGLDISAQIDQGTFHAIC